MKLALYEELGRLFQQGHASESIREQYQSTVPLHTLQGVEQRVAQATGRRRIWKFESRNIPPAKLLDTFMSRWERGNERTDVIEQMATENGRVPPCFLARLLVKAYAERLKPRPISCEIDDLADAAELKTVTRTVCGESSSLTNSNLPVTEDGPPKLHISAAKWYRAPALIPHKGLSNNVAHCHAIDKYYSPSMDEFRNRIGREYEERLNRHLDALGVVYLDEPKMRKMGYARTPDAVLSEPIAVEGRVVKWIESKAWFGDPPSHATYLRDQYWPYYNRFGPGLVIYWFGFVEESVLEHLDRGVVVMEDFPQLSTITKISSSLESLVKLYSPRKIASEVDNEYTWDPTEPDDQDNKS